MNGTWDALGVGRDIIEEVEEGACKLESSSLCVCRSNCIFCTKSEGS